MVGRRILAEASLLVTARRYDLLELEIFVEISSFATALQLGFDLCLQLVGALLARSDLPERHLF